MSSSTSQTADPATMSEDQLAAMLSNVKSSRETEALRARLPAPLAPFASNIRITEPTRVVCTSNDDGVNCSSMSVQERRVYMSVTPHSSSPSASRAKPLKLIWRDWRTGSRYVSGSADSHKHSVGLLYGPLRGTHSKGMAFTGWYEDPGISMFEYSHGGIKSVVEEVVRDMGFRENGLNIGLEVIQALLGDDGKYLLENYGREEKTLWKVIEDELDMPGSASDDW